MSASFVRHTLALAVFCLGLSSCDRSSEPAEGQVYQDGSIEATDVAGREPSFRLVLPTDNRNIFSDPSSYYMYTDRTFEGVKSKPWQGGQYGFVRNQKRTGIGVVFTRLHEGIDVKPVRRDKNGEPLDDVYAISDGTVVYVNPSASASSFGKYVVVQHDWPEGAFYSLYAHLAFPSVKVEQPVKAGDTLGRLGYTGRGINKERAHVHVELNFMLSDRFKTWYGKHFTSKNHHDIFNGFNLTGMDIARLYREKSANPAITIREFLAKEEAYFKVRAPGKNPPGVLRRHPWLGREMEGAASATSWEYTFARSGVPLSIRPSTESLRYPLVTSVKPVNTNHSFLTMGRIEGSGSKASLSGSGSRYIQLISEAF